MTGRSILISKTRFDFSSYVFKHNAFIYIQRWGRSCTGLKPHATCARKRPPGGAVALQPRLPRWQPEKVGLAWWHSQISQVTHYVIFWAGDQCVIMSCRNSASPACRNSCAHWQLAPPLNIKMFCCCGTPTDAFPKKRHKHGIQECEREFRAPVFPFPPNFTLKGDLSVVQARRRPRCDTYCGFEAHYVICWLVIDVACFLPWQESWQQKPRGA